jgi:hypothetical protein
MRRKAIIGIIIGATLGCLVGALTDLREPATNGHNPYLMSLNQRTGRPQLHVQGKAEVNN